MKPRTLGGITFGTWLALGSGCADSPVAPQPPPVAQPSQAPPPTIRLTGHVVDAERKPVAGARMMIAGLASPVLQFGPILTDQSGHYGAEVTGRSAIVFVERDGFDAGTYYPAWPDAESGDLVTRDFRMHAPLRLTAGESISFDLVAEDPACPDYDFQEPCRSVRFIAPVNGWLTVEVEPQLMVMVNGGPRRQVPTPPGSETQVDVVLLNAPSPQHVRIRTTFQPI
jgi:hypothetical protein